MTQEIKTHGLTFILDGDIIHFKSEHDGGFEKDILPGDLHYEILREMFSEFPKITQAAKEE